MGVLVTLSTQNTPTMHHVLTHINLNFFESVLLMHEGPFSSCARPEVNRSLVSFGEGLNDRAVSRGDYSLCSRLRLLYLLVNFHTHRFLQPRCVSGMTNTASTWPYCVQQSIETLLRHDWKGMDEVVVLERCTHTLDMLSSFHKENVF